MGRSSRFGSTACDSVALFGLGFPTAPDLLVLSLATYRDSPAHFAKGTQSGIHESTRRPDPLQPSHLLVGTRFQVLFHSPPGVLFTFPSRYYALSVTREYLALEGGPPRFRQDSACPTLLGRAPQGEAYLFAYGAITLYGPLFQHGSAKVAFCNSPALSLDEPRCFPRPPTYNGQDLLRR